MVGPGAFELDLFEPNSRYLVEVVTAEEPRADIDGPTSMSATFTTTAELSPPIELVGQIQMSLRVGTAERVGCATMNSCGGGG